MATKYIRKISHKTFEECPHCDNEVKLKWVFEVQECPECHKPILPCSICEHTNENGCHTECSTCPLNDLLKEAWIDKIMSTVYSTDSDKSYNSNVIYLRTLTIERMEKMYDDWNGCEALDEVDYDELDLLNDDDEI
jgi:hypothetical protein